MADKMWVKIDSPSPENAEIMAKAKELAELCDKQGRGMVFAPMAHSYAMEENADTKTLLVCTLSPLELGAALFSICDNYRKNLPTEDVEEFDEILRKLGTKIFAHPETMAEMAQ